MRTTITCQINAPTDTVFRRISDIERLPELVPHIVGVEFLSDKKTGVGTRFRETRSVGGSEAVTELELTEYVENESLRFVADSHGTIWDTVYTLKAVNGGTELTLVMDAKAYRWLPKIINVAMKGMVKRAVAKDVDCVKEYCEKASGAV